jgi:hypothetical protein
LIARILIELGFTMGFDLNESLDDLGFTALFKRASLWPLHEHRGELQEALEIYLTSRGVPTPKGINNEQQVQRCKAAIDSRKRHEVWQECGTLQDRMASLGTVGEACARWGWKEPNSHIFLPFLLQSLPLMRYIHVVRDGRDMAYSSNTSQVQLWRAHLLSEPPSDNVASDALDFWCESHRRLLSIQQRQSANVRIIRLESMIENPRSVIRELLQFLEVSEDAERLKSLCKFVTPQSTLKRYQAMPALRITPRNAEVLEAMGYELS